MIYNWYFIFNLVDFQNLGLVSRTYTVELQGIGIKDILVTQGEYVSMIYEGVMLPLNLTEKNPFEFEGMAVYIDANDDCFLGFLNED